MLECYASCPTNSEKKETGCDRGNVVPFSFVVFHAFYIPSDATQNFPISSSIRNPQYNKDNKFIRPNSSFVATVSDS